MIRRDRIRKWDMTTTIGLKVTLVLIYARLKVPCSLARGKLFLSEGVLNVLEGYDGTWLCVKRSATRLTSLSQYQARSPVL